MRIVIAGPPKTGNVWLKCILGNAYGLRPIGPRQVPERPQYAAFVAWAERDGFKDGTIFHQHYDYSPELADAFDEAGATTVTIIRDPYDMFVSTYFTIQGYAPDDPRRGQQGPDQVVMMGKPIDHPDVLRHLERDGYQNNLTKANEWLHSGRAAVARYEALKRNPVGALKRLTDQIEPVAAERLARAIEPCSAENMRQKSPSHAKHIRTATVGDSRNHLTEAHLAIFRERYGDLIRSLGYDVR